MILCSGCFDGIHIGHVRYLRRAREIAGGRDSLIVAVAPDDYIRAVKGRDPVWTLTDRLDTVRALRLVDGAHDHSKEGAADSILKLSPRMFIKGSDWEGRLPRDVRDACAAVGCEIVFVGSGVPQHTSDALSAQ